MEGTPHLHNTLEQVLRQHQNRMGCRYPKTLAWMIVGLIQARAVCQILRRDEFVGVEAYRSMACSTPSGTNGAKTCMMASSRYGMAGRLREPELWGKVHLSSEPSYPSAYSKRPKSSVKQTNHGASRYTV
jgi:hypothetical protein